MKKEYTLAIETSCDDTSMAIFKKDELLSLVTSTSLSEHTKYGGIVPEVASRSHCENIDKVFDQALKEANILPSQIVDIAYTSEPGLIGSLHIGKIFAKTLGSILNIPVFPINHIYAHLFSCYITQKATNVFPKLGLVVSGGTTCIYLLKNWDDISIINETTDDACGECLDKIGRALKLPYPGGISIDKIYVNDYEKIKLPNHQKPELNFSFSGIKSHIFNTIKRNGNLTKEGVKVVASSALDWIVNDIELKLNFYLEKYNCKELIIGGGVSCNKRLREKLASSLSKNTTILWPLAKYTGDNAAMIGIYHYFLKNMKKNYNF